MRKRLFKITAAVFLLCAAAVAQDLAAFEKHITVKKLDNGLTAIVYERPEAPVFSFFNHVDAGSVQDPTGQTGMAHMFEHMAFKGTDKIGTTDYAAEKPALEPYGPEDLAATMYHLLGIDPADEFYTPEGRPVKIVNGGKVIQSLL